jgi:hypothetical protein
MKTEEKFTIRKRSRNIREAAAATLSRGRATSMKRIRMAVKARAM